MPRVDDPLPAPAEQASSLILWIGDHQASPEVGAEILEQTLSAVIDTAITPTNWEFAWLLTQGEVTRHFEHRGDPDKGINFSLTFDSWQRYEASMPMASLPVLSTTSFA